MRYRLGSSGVWHPRQALGTQHEEISQSRSDLSKGKKKPLRLATISLQRKPLYSLRDEIVILPLRIWPGDPSGPIPLRRREDCHPPNPYAILGRILVLKDCPPYDKARVGLKGRIQTAIVPNKLRIRCHSCPSLRGLEIEHLQDLRFSQRISQAF